MEKQDEVPVAVGCKVRKSTDTEVWTKNQHGY